MPSARSHSSRARATRAPGTVPTSALKPCDVFLYDGTGWLAEAIRFFDGTRYNHAGLYLGDNTVAEALAPGVIRQGLDKSIAGRNEVLVRRLKQDVPGMDPVLQRGLTIVGEGHRYAYEQLLLLVFLCLTRKLKVTPALRPLIRHALDKAASLVTGWIGAGREPMICSEFVFRSYDEALPEAGDMYQLEIGVATRSRGPMVAMVARGRGVHPDSLLAWRVSRGMRSWSGGSGSRTPTTRARVVDDPRPLEELIQEYLAEARTDARPRGRGPVVSDADVSAALDRFALAMDREQQRGARSAAASEVAVRRLLATAGDFVTPGDLLLTDSLFTVGPLELS